MSDYPLWKTPMLRTCVLTMAVLAMLTTTGVAQDKKKVENPDYTVWAKFKPGTSYTTKTILDLGGKKTESTRVTKLVEMTADKVVIESGDKGDAKTFKQDVPRWLQEGEKVRPEIPEKATEDGTETLKIGGTEVKTKRYKHKEKDKDGETESTFWQSVGADVPVQVVKMVSKDKGGSISFEVIEITKK